MYLMLNYRNLVDSWECGIHCGNYVWIAKIVGVPILLALVDDALMAPTTLVLAFPRKLDFLNLGHHYGFFINNVTIVNGKPHVWLVILKCY
jgi:hypothetical protein